MARTLALIASSLVVFSSASAEQFNNIVTECWEGNDHPKMSACVRLRAAQAHAALKTLEVEVHDVLAKNKEPAYAKAASASFEANVKSFRQYRRDQCTFVFKLASLGNGPEDNQRACEAELDISRVEQLKAATWWLEK